MANHSLEKILEKQPLFVSEHLRQESLSYAIGLYYKSVGLSALNNETLWLYGKNLERLTLPQRLLVHRDMKKKAKEYILQADVAQAQNHARAAHYFWQNFIVISH